MYIRCTRSACMPLNVNLARSPERVEMPLRGCLGTRSTGKAAMNWLLFQRLSAIRMFLIEECQNLEKVKMFRVAGHRVSGVLETSQLHLGLQGARRELAPIARMFEVAALPQVGVVDVPEGHEGPQ